MASAETPLHARLSRRHLPMTAVAVALATGGVVLVASWVRWPAVVHVVAGAQPLWIIPMGALVALAVVGYALAYHGLSCLEQAPEGSFSDLLRMVAAGFGPFVVAGGFALDQHVLTARGATPRQARVLVLGLGALEYGVLAPATWLCAVILLVQGAPGVEGELLWSWALAVPAGFVLGLWFATPQRRERVVPRTHLRTWLREALDGVALLWELGSKPIRYGTAWAGMALYWAAEIVLLYCALRLFGTHLDAPHVVLAYATGYPLTRRSTPFGGAGATEILMSLSLHWVGVPLARALPPVVAYRVANLLLPALPAMHAHRHIHAALRARERGHLRPRGAKHNGS